MAQNYVRGIVQCCCPVGRGDLTPPGCLAVAAKLHGTVKTVPYKQPEGKVSSGKMQISGRFVGDAYMRPVRFARCVAMSV